MFVVEWRAALTDVVGWITFTKRPTREEAEAVVESEKRDDAEHDATGRYLYRVVEERDVNAPHLLTRTDVQNFCIGINSSAWNLGLMGFCERTGLFPDAHGKEKFEALKRLQSALSEFDTDTLCKLAGVKE